MRRILTIILMFIISTSTVAYGDINIEKDIRSYILADFETGQILESNNIYEVVEIASISKLMSYLVIMDEIYMGNIGLDDNIIIDKDTTKIKGSSFKLKVGEEFTVRELIDAGMVVSANDAIYALSKHVAKTEESFVILMNEKAKELGLVNSVFYNSTGLPVQEKNVQNKMTTREIFELSKYIIKTHPGVLETSRQRSIEVVSRDFFQRNTNPLLMEIKEVDGLKTGFTNKAGYCYVSTFNIQGKPNNTKDLRLIAIIMGAKNMEERNEMSKVLIEYGLSNYSHKIFLDREISLNTLNFPKGDITDVDTFPDKEFSRLIKMDENITLNIYMDEDIKLPITKDTIVGKVIVEDNGQAIFETDILIKDNVNKAKWHIIVGRFFEALFDGIKATWDEYWN